MNLNFCIRAVLGMKLIFVGFSVEGRVLRLFEMNPHISRDNGMMLFVSDLGCLIFSY